jgi:esterase/lipase
MKRPIFNLIVALLLFSVARLHAETRADPFYSDKLNLLVYIDDKRVLQPVKTVNDWARRRQHLVTAMQRVMGPLPDNSRKVPLDVQLVEEVQLAKCIRRKITFAVEKDDRVSAYLLIPNTLNVKAPAMLCLHQTTGIGKGEPAGVGGNKALHYALELAERGYVALAPDFPYFGDYKIDVYAMGYQSGTMKGIWNHMRCVDLLESMNEVDTERIGVIGHSLGGHNALFLSAFETRVKVVVTSCGFTSFAKYSYGGKGLSNWTGRQYMPKIASVYNNDAEKMPFDFPDILAAIAPRAVFINAPVNDENFALQGVKECVTAAEPIFKLLNAEGKLQAVHPASGHTFSSEVRQQAYEFLEKSLAVKPK